MNSRKPDAKPLELELVAIDTPADDPSRNDGAPTQPAKSLGITSADPFLEEAAREYQTGKVDKALWSRTMAVKGNDDESIAIAAYLRARATAIEAERRNARAAARAEGPPSASPTSRMGGPTTGTRAGSQEGPPSAMRGTPTQGPRTRSRDTPPSRSPARSPARRPGVPRNVMYLGAAAAALSFVAVLLWVLAAPHQTESARQALNNAVRSAPAARPAPVPAVATVAAAPAGDPTLADKVQEMKRVGNWNVLVLNANEWTRKEPSNAAAWRELGQGYVKLRQFDEALEAATRATTLAPADPEAWNGLGRVNVALERWRDAGVAFDKVLAVRADDPDALCGAVLVARRELRPKDADALARRITDDAACKTYGESQSVAVMPRTKSAQN
jgi:tetratricopeptide (TPR) repeat protein